MLSTTSGFYLRKADKSTKLVIICSPLGFKPGTFHMLDVGNELDANVLYINDTDKNWYQNGIEGLGGDIDTCVAAIDTIRKDLGIKETYAVGQSMGASGAILYGCLLNVPILAFSAETKLLLPCSRSIDTFPENSNLPYPDLSALIIKKKPALTLISGEIDAIDLYASQQVTHLSCIKSYTMRNIGHGPAGYLGNRDRLLPLLQRFIDKKPVKHMPEFGSALENNSFAGAFYNAFCANKEKDYDTAATEAEKAIDIYPVNPESYFQLGSALSAIGNLKGALSAYATASSLLPTKVEYCFGVANCLRRLGFVQEARQMHNKNLKKWPNHAKSHYDISLCYQKLKNTKMTLEHAQKSYDLDENNKAFYKHLVQVSN